MIQLDPGAFRAALGTVSLGLFIGLVSRYCWRRFSDYSPGAIATLIAAVLGTAVVAFIGLTETVRWFYPIGLIGGVSLRPRQDQGKIFVMFLIVIVLALGSFALPKETNEILGTDRGQAHP